MINRSTSSVIVTVVANEYGGWVQILDLAVGISHSANTFVESCNPLNYPSRYGQIVGQSKLFKPGITTGLD